MKVGVAKEGARADGGIIDQANVIQDCYRMKTKLAWRSAAAVLTADLNANRSLGRTGGKPTRVRGDYECDLRRDGEI
jgi:hypothetical protein